MAVCVSPTPPRRRARLKLGRSESGRGFDEGKRSARIDLDPALRAREAERLRVLLAEDDWAIAESGRVRFATRRFRLGYVRTGGAALAGEPAGVVMLDLGLPHLDRLVACPGLSNRALTAAQRDHRGLCPDRRVGPSDPTTTLASTMSGKRGGSGSGAAWTGSGTSSARRIVKNPAGALGESVRLEDRPRGGVDVVVRLPSGGQPGRAGRELGPL